jgi:23S rRNA (uracil1939-C5)-methyltransferase
MGRRKRKLFQNVEIIDIADKGKAVGRDEKGEVIFVDGAVPGDVLDVMGLRKKKGVWQGIPHEFKKESPERQQAQCEHFEDCGGCKWQHFEYKGQIRYKEQSVRDAVRRIGKLEQTNILPIIGAPKIFHYRNKMEYSFSRHRWITEAEVQSGEEVDGRNALGLHRPGSWDKIVDLHYCHLQQEPGNTIRNEVKSFAIEQGWSFYDPRAQEGWLRALILRNNEEGEFMLTLVASERKEEQINELYDHLKDRFEAITSLYFIKNDKKNDSVADLDAEHWWGEEYLDMKIGDIHYKLGPKSFFQTNTQQAKNLYDKVIEMADFQGHENVYDLYTGIGSIALYVAPHVEKVVGIEEIEEAVADAQRNVQLNDEDRIQFYAGDVRDLLKAEFAREHGKPDVVITDPPRAGMHQDVVDMLLELESPKIVYVSCNPATQARDLNLLSKKYEIPKVQPVDMFPHTHHIEAVAQLKLKS